MRRLFESATLLAALALLWTAVFVPVASAQARSKRLILKDGSYQAASKWEIKGDRVRYLSSERFAWEELPTSLIDWPATEKYNAAATAPPDENTKQAEAEDKAAREAEAAASPTVAPGLRLPETGGVFLVDTFNGQPQLDELVQNGSEINQNRTKNILRATVNPLASAKQTIEVKGQHASVQSHVSAPTIYVNVNQAEQSAAASSQTGVTPSSGDLDQEPDRYRIAKLETKKDVRVLGSVNISMIGRTKEQQKFVPSKIEAMAGGWVKITPSQPLVPGEYALVEMLNAKEMNLYVWDFGVNPNAPANPTAWKPKPVPSTQTGTQATPVLKRPK